jgi:hypothetical protein
MHSSRPCLESAAPDERDIATDFYEVHPLACSFRLNVQNTGAAGKSPLIQNEEFTAARDPVPKPISLLCKGTIRTNSDSRSRIEHDHSSAYDGIA